MIFFLKIAQIGQELAKLAINLKNKKKTDFLMRSPGEARTASASMYVGFKFFPEICITRFAGNQLKKVRREKLKVFRGAVVPAGAGRDFCCQKTWFFIFWSTATITTECI